MLVVLCPGQGSQTPGFLSPWLELDSFASVVSSLSEASGIDIAKHGTENLPQLFDEHFERSYTWASTSWD